MPFPKLTTYQLADKFRLQTGSPAFEKSLSTLARGLVSPNGTFVGTATDDGLVVAGTATNGNATAGALGEYVVGVKASGSAVSLTTATPANVTSISLTPGDWDVYGVTDYVLTGGTVTALKSGSNGTSATFGGQDTFSSKITSLTTATGTLTEIVPLTRVSLAATTTIYLVAQATFSAGTVTAYGTLRARRAR